ncbi:Rab3 GTPase-activating protein regulatory subunit N-terminus-domain-containing protein [Zopfochytrium polystomum]|nr:Rab3 GTPase-activating protein regulatory subunit N-terminus-domain-containing protein [Zopfochytrium polystomum]
MSASIHTRSSTDAFEELVVLYDDSTVSILDGNSLASYFTYCRKFGTSSHPIHLRTLKLESPGPIFDVVSLGPAARWGADVKASSAVVGNSIPEAHRVSTRLCTAGKSPMLSFYTLKDSGGTLFSLSGLVANTSSAMSVIAKTIWNGVSANPGVSVDSTASGSAVPAPKAVQPIMSLSDNNRSITKLLAAPPHPQLSYRNLAASLDTLGRILLIDLENGDIVRIIKGVRNAQIGWLQARGDFATPSDESIFLFLCVYSPRGVLEIISMRHGDRVVALNVGREMILVQSNPAALGALYSTFERPLASCWLVSPQNQVKEIRIKDSVALKQTRPESMMDNLLGDTDTGVLFKRIIAAPDVATQFCMLLCLPSSTSPSKTLDLLREISVEPDLNYVGPSMQTLSDSRRQASLQLNVVRQVVVVIDWIIKNSSTASSLQEEIPWKADLTPFLRLHFEVSRSSPIVNNGVPWTTDLLLCFRTEKTSKRGESLLLRIIANAHQRRILAGIFLQPLLDGRLTFDLWSTHVFNRLGLSISSWFGLFSAVSRDVSFETTTAEAAVRLCAFLAFLLERAMLDNNLQVLQDLFDHARSITSLPKSLIYIWPMRVVLGQISFKARTFFLSQVEDTFVKLGDCLHLGKSVGFELLAREKVSLLNFNETETRRAARLIATFEVERLAAGNSPVEVHAISSYFGASAMTDVVIYSCLELAQFVAMDPNRTDLFDGMLSRVRAISHPVLRTAVSAFIFQYVLSPRLIASLRLEDFSDDFDLGVLDLETPTATTFMERMRTLIGENCLVIDAGDSISADDLRTDLIDALKVPPLTPIRLFANGPVGGIISKIPTTGGTVLDSQLVLLNQSGLSLLLQGHRTPNSSRAVDLLRNSSRFGTLFSSGGRTADLYAEIDAFEDARRSFILGGL